MKIGINGFGRIGCQVSRLACEENGMEIVHINNLTETHTLSCLLQFDKPCGLYPD